MIHPTSKEIFDFEDSSDYTSNQIFVILRMFIAAEYDRDPTVLDRLKVWLAKMGTAKEETEAYIKNLKKGEEFGFDTQTSAWVACSG